MKLNLIFGIVLILGWGASYILGLNRLDISLHIEAKGVQQQEHIASDICNNSWDGPVTLQNENRLSSTLKLSLSSDSSVLGLTFQGLENWLDLNLDTAAESSVSYGKGWRRRSL